MTSSGILNHLPEDLKQTFKFHIFDEVDSTNTLLRNYAENAALEGTVIIASSQTAGRGRKGRSFISPDGTGIYMSLLLRPPLHISEATIITAAAASATAIAIETLTTHTPKIKWVNDIIIDGKKVCGILTEASIDAKSGNIDYAILGIGINVYTPTEGFEKEIQDIAGSIYEHPQEDLKNRLVASILAEFMSYYSNLDKRFFLDDYTTRSCVIGREINVISAYCIKKATAVDIDKNCRLGVKYPNGSTEYLSSGEISIKL